MFTQVKTQNLYSYNSRYEKWYDTYSSPFESDTMIIVNKYEWYFLLSTHCFLDKARNTEIQIVPHIIFHRTASFGILPPMQCINRKESLLQYLCKTFSNSLVGMMHFL